MVKGSAKCNFAELPCLYTNGFCYTFVMSHHIYTTPGFVIGSRPQGEANKYLYIFTRDLGMVGASAQGVRLEKSKLRYHVQDFSYSIFSLVRGKEVWRMTSAADSAGLLSAITSNERYFEIYVKILSLLKRLLHGEEKHEALFDVCISGFTFLSDSEADEPFLRNFECLIVLRTLHLLGYIGKVKELEGFLSIEWSKEIVGNAGSHKKRIVEEINRALQESQL